MESFFITGGLGFIGVHLVEHLLKSHPSCHITIFDNNTHADRHKLLPKTNRITVIQGDIRDKTAVSTAISEVNPDTVVHLAALHYIPYCVKNPQETRDVNITGTENILQAIKEAPSCRTFVMASSAAVYKDQEKNFSEADPLEAIDIYGETKIACEMLLPKLLPSHVDCRVLRFFNVFGNDDPIPHVIPEIIDQLAAGTPLRLGTTENYRDFIHVTDIASAIDASLDRALGKYRILNVGTGRQVSVQEIVRTAEALIKKHHPDFNLKTAPLDNQRVRKSDRKTLCANISEITTQTSWRPQVTLESGLDKLLEKNGVYAAIAKKYHPRKSRKQNFKP